MAKLFNRVGMTITGTPGTGTITLNAAITTPKKYQSFATAGVVNTDVVSYLIEDGVEFELGIGTYTSSGTTLSRDTVRASSNGGAKISATSAALVYIDAGAEDLPLNDTQTFLSSGTWTKPQGNFRWALIKVGGGGGSGGVRTTTGNAGGGGGGSHARRIVPFSSLAATETVTIGNGGAAVASSNANGNIGSDTSFGTWVTARGGDFGENAAAGAAAVGGAGAGLRAAGSTHLGGVSSPTVISDLNASTDFGGAAGAGSTTGNVSTGNVSGAGGVAFNGGSGGGVAISTASADTLGGVSVGIGGNGGNGSGTTPTAGAQSSEGGGGGGGGGARNGQASGAGGKGSCQVICW
jgi:hypothetical protein